MGRVQAARLHRHLAVYRGTHSIHYGFILGWYALSMALCPCYRYDRGRACAMHCVRSIWYAEVELLTSQASDGLTRSSEIYVDPKRPIIPMHLFKNPDYCVFTVVSAVGGMLYYSLNGKYTRSVEEFEISAS